jgi:hypothetical protein
MVEVFKTDVEQVNVANQIIQKLLEYFPESKINFDLDDCDNILRVEGKIICIERIIEVMNSNGFHCIILN